MGTPNSKRANPVLINDPLETVLANLGVAPEHWDAVIVGDGSGSNWAAPCGWASVLVQKTQDEPQVFYGAMNRGTSNVAEILAYVAPLEYLASLEATRRDKHGARPRAVRVHIITDSEYVQKTGTGSHLAARRNTGLWAIFEVYKRSGIVLFWHWQRRDTTALNRYTDALGRDARLLIQRAKLKQRLELKRGPAAAHTPRSDGPTDEIDDAHVDIL